MAETRTIEVHLYGKLRRFTAERQPDALSVLHMAVGEGETIATILERIGVPREEVGSNVFLNWQYASLRRPVQAGDRLAVFPDDMQLLYKWYFEKQ